MFELDPQLLTIVALASAVVGLVALVAAALVGLRLRRVRRELQEALGGDGASVVEVLGRHNVQLDAVRQDIGELGLRTDELRGLLRRTVSKSALVRYDAFEDMGGALSFSTALLDEQGDGVVISAINGRTETRCYAKPISQGASETNLSGEEHAAIEAAMSDRPVPSPTAPSAGRRRRRAS
jgi:hypothetical protein